MKKEEKKAEIFIPIDIIINITSFLDLNEVRNFSMVNRFWKEALGSMQFWSIFFLRDFGKEKVVKSLNSSEELKKLYKEFWEASNSTNLIFMGPVDSGKSSLIGEIFFEFNKNMKIITDLRRVAAKMGMYYFKKIFLCDNKREEMERGISIHPFRSLQIPINKSKTEKSVNFHKINLIDTPGHIDYFKNTVKTVNCFKGKKAIPVLVIDGNNTFSDRNTTRMNAKIAKTFSSQIIVAINKLDRLPNMYNQFVVARKGICKILTSKDIGFKRENIHCVPISPWSYFNISRRAPYFERSRYCKIVLKKENLKFWKNEQCLLEKVQNVITINRRNQQTLKKRELKAKKTLRVSIMQVKSRNQIVARIFSGSFRTKQELTFGNGESFICKKIVNYQSLKNMVVAREENIVIVTLNKEFFPNQKKGLKDTQKRMIKRLVIGSKKSPPEYSRIVVGTFLNLEQYVGIVEGYSPCCVVGGIQFRIKILKIIEKKDEVKIKVLDLEGLMKKNFRKKALFHPTIPRGKEGKVIVELIQPTSLESFEDLPYLGNLTVLDNRKLLGFIKIEKILKKEFNIIKVFE